MAHVAGVGLGRPPVFVIDREADSVAHLRAWSAAGHEYLVRAEDARGVPHGGAGRTAAEVADGLRGGMKRSRAVLYRGRPATQFVAEATVLLTRPAYPKQPPPPGSRRGSGRSSTARPGPCGWWRPRFATAKGRCSPGGCC